jgi:sarcosine oxidase
MEHHARFTFALRDPAAEPPCWLDRSQAWQPGFTGYGHLAGPGLWAAGLHRPGGQTRWERGREQVVRASAEAVGRYVTEHLTGLLPGAVETVYCTTMADAGDGVSAERAGPVLAVWGNNLFKHAPYLAEVLVAALASGELPTDFETAAPS